MSRLSPRAPGARTPVTLAVPGLLAVVFLLLPLLGILARTPWGDLGTHLSSPGVTEAVRLSLLVSFWALGLSLLLGVPLAWLLARVDFPGKAVVRSLVLLPMVLPPTVGGVALLLGFGRRGLLGPWLEGTFGIVLPFHTSGAVVAATFVAMPFLVISLEGTLAGLRPSYEETAASLGASPLRVFCTVTLPMAAPGLAAGAALAWARALGEFGATITFAGNLTGSTQTLPLQVYLLLQDSPEAATSVSLLLLAIAMVVLVALRGRWAGGGAGRPGGGPARRASPGAPDAAGGATAAAGTAWRSGLSATSGLPEGCGPAAAGAEPRTAAERSTGAGRAASAEPSGHSERPTGVGPFTAPGEVKKADPAGTAGSAHVAAPAGVHVAAGSEDAQPVTASTAQGWALHTTVTGFTDLTLDAEGGTTLAVVGPNGAGKTTLLRALLGLTPRARATVRLGGTDVTRLPPHRRGVAWVPQDGALFPHLSALSNTAYGLRAHGVRRTAARRGAQQWLDRLGVGRLAHRKPGQLSGGQAQRVALARALAARPRLLLLDEPLAALDQTTRAQVRHTLRTHLAGFGGVCLMVTHDPVEAVALADRVLVLEDGRAVQDAPPAEVTRHPRSPWVARMLGRNAWSGTTTEEGLQLPGGARLVAAEPAEPAGEAAPRPSGTAGTETGTEAIAVIAPEAVALHRERPAGSPRNVWPGTVREVTALGSRLRVLVACDDAPELVAEITPAAAAEMRLSEGSAVYASVKATEVTLVVD